MALQSVTVFERRRKGNSFWCRIGFRVAPVHGAIEMNLARGTIFVIMCMPIFCVSCNAIDTNISCSASSGRVCVEPFEAIYANRSKYIGKRIEVDGVLLVGPRGEFPNVSTALLFSSIEKAEICDYELAIEVVTGSPNEIEALKKHDGQIVQVRGILRKSKVGHWATIEADSDPVPLMETGKQFPRCLKLPPPGPLPPLSS